MSRWLEFLFASLKRCPTYADYRHTLTSLLSGLTIVSGSAFIVAVTSMNELWEYTIKIVVDPMIRPERSTFHEWSECILGCFLFDRGRVSALWWLMNIILGVGPRHGRCERNFVRKSLPEQCYLD